MRAIGDCFDSGRRKSGKLKNAGATSFAMMRLEFESTLAEITAILAEITAIVTANRQPPQH